MFETRKIKALDLLSWDENFRLPDILLGQNQEIIRKALLDDEKRHGVREFAKEVIKDFEWVPQLEKLVVVPNGDKYVVYEGNRRVVAYQCLINPTLAGVYQNEFHKLISQKKIPKDFELECLVTDIEMAFYIIKRKHLNSNNEKHWGQYEADNLANRAKKQNLSGDIDMNRIRRANIGKLLEATDFSKDVIKKILGRGYVTNFYRIVDSKPGYNYFGISVNYDGEISLKDENELLDKLKFFALDLLTNKRPEGKSWSRAYNTSEEIERYLESLDSSRITRKIENIEEDKIITSSDITRIDESDHPQVKKQSIYTTAKEKEWPTLIKPTRRRLLVGEKSEKINAIYKELQYVVIKDCPHAVSVLLRVLIEITIQHFLELNGEKFTPDGGIIAKEGKPRTELKQKIAYVAENYAKGSMKLAMISLNENLFTQSLNQVVHNIGYFATEKQVRDFWKTLKSIFEFLVQNIMEKESGLNAKS